MLSSATKNPEHKEIVPTNNKKITMYLDHPLRISLGILFINGLIVSPLDLLDGYFLINLITQDLTIFNMHNMICHMS